MVTAELRIKGENTSVWKDRISIMKQLCMQNVGLKKIGKPTPTQHAL
jgi:hypothetical protein